MEAIGYVRVSTEDQAKEGISLENQTEKIKAICKAKDWDLQEIIKDEGKSAKDLKREGVQRIITLANSKKFDILVIYRLDRLTRNVRDLGFLVQDVFDKHGIAFSSIQESFDTSNAAGRLMLNLIGCIAQWERETISERIKDGLRYKKSRMQCYGPVPFGFTLEEKTLKPNGEELEIVKQIKSLRDDNCSYREIAAHLNADGFKTRAGRDWFSSSVQIIAKNSIYASPNIYVLTE